MDFTSFEKLVQRIKEVRSAIVIAQAAPDAAREALHGAVIGHKSWDGYGLREVQNKDGLHSRAVEAVTDYLVNDLAERKRIELLALADELDQLRASLADGAKELRFSLLDDVLSARTWTPTPERKSDELDASG